MVVHSNPREEWAHAAADLGAHREAQRQAWGDIDNATLGRYLAGEATSAERAHVESALEKHPEFRTLMDLVAEALRGDSDPGSIPVPAPAPARTGVFARFRKMLGLDARNAQVLSDNTESQASVVVATEGTTRRSLTSSLAGQ